MAKMKGNKPIQGAWLDEIRALMVRQWKCAPLSYSALQRLASDKYFGAYDALYIAIRSIPLNPKEPMPYLLMMAKDRETVKRLNNEAAKMPTPKSVESALAKALGTKT